MIEFTEEQQDRFQRLYNDYKDRVNELEERIEAGKKTPLALQNVGYKYRSIGVYSVYNGDIKTSQERFQLASKYFADSAKLAKTYETELNTFQRIPITLLEGLYVAILSGDRNQQQIIAKMILKLDRTELPPHEFIDEPVEFHADKYYLARCVAGAIFNKSSTTDIQALEEINRDKNGVNRLYGQAVIDFVRGVDRDSSLLLTQGIESMIEYHDQNRSSENVVDLVMSPQATALLIIARQNGYEITVDSEFIPEQLVAAAVDDTSSEF